MFQYSIKSPLSIAIDNTSSSSIILYTLLIMSNIIVDDFAIGKVLTTSSIIINDLASVEALFQEYGTVIQLMK